MSLRELPATLIYAAAFTLASSALISPGYASSKTNRHLQKLGFHQDRIRVSDSFSEMSNDGRVPPVDGNVQFSSTRWRLVRQTFILNIPPNSNPLAQIIIATPSTVAVSNDIDVLDRKGRKININVSVNGKNIIIAFPEPVASGTKLVINLNKVEQPIGGSTSVYRFSAKVVGSDEEIPAGVVELPTY